MPSDTPPQARQSSADGRLRGLRSFAGAVWRWRYRALLIMVVVLAAGYFGVPAVLGPVVVTEPVIRGEFVQSVVATGNVLAPYRVNIGSQIVGIVGDVPVAEGQSVQAGQPLITLDDREAQAAVVQASGAFTQAEARLRQIREVVLPSAEQALKQANATLLNAQQAHARANQLAADGFGTRATLDDATRALNVAQAQVRAAEFQVHTNREGGSDYVMADMQLNQARANLETAKSRLSYTVVKAPRDGVLILRNVEKGDIVQPGSILMVLSPFGETQLTVQIDERNIGLIALGQKALVSADAFPDRTFDAEIIYINPGIDLQRASVQVKLRVPDPPAYLQQDMTVSVDIETARHPGATIAPAIAVRGLNTRKPWVLVADAGRARRREIQTGSVGGGKVEILSGLLPGDQLVPSGSPVVDGERIRARHGPERAP